MCFIVFLYVCVCMLVLLCAADVEYVLAKATRFDADASPLSPVKRRADDPLSAAASPVDGPAAASSQHSTAAPPIAPYSTTAVGEGRDAGRERKDREERERRISDANSCTHEASGAAPAKAVSLGPQHFVEAILRLTAVLSSTLGVALPLQYVRHPCCLSLYTYNARICLALNLATLVCSVLSFEVVGVVAVVATVLVWMC